MKAFTLVETLVASAIATILFLAAWGLLNSGVRMFSSTQAHLEAVQSAQFALERIESDLHSIITSGPGDESVLKTFSRRSTLSFHVSRNSRGRGGVYFGEPVSYSLEPVAGRRFGYLRRNDRIFTSIRLLRLEFIPLEIRSFENKTHYYMRTIVTAVDAKDSDEFTLIGQVALAGMTGMRLNPFWKKNGPRYKVFPVSP